MKRILRIICDFHKWDLFDIHGSRAKNFTESVSTKLVFHLNKALTAGLSPCLFNKQSKMKRMESVAPDDFNTINKRVKLKVQYLPVQYSYDNIYFFNFSEIMNTYCCQETVMAALSSTKVKVPGSRSVGDLSIYRTPSGNSFTFTTLPS
jgi:hypothetical protein